MLQNWRVQALFLAALTLILFQNCGMSVRCQPNDAAGAQCVSQNKSNHRDDVPATEASVPLVNPTEPNNQTNTNASQGGPSALLGGGGGGGAGGSLAVGGAMNTGATGLGNNNTNIGSSVNNSFRITVQPQALVIQTNQYSSTFVAIAGGTPPYKYKWYKNDQPLSTGTLSTGQYCNDTYTCGIYGDSYSKEGRYKVVISDAKGVILTSETVSVSILDPEVGCLAGDYMAHSGSSNLTDSALLKEVFKNTRGAYIVHSSHPLIADFMYNFAMFDFVLAGKLSFGKHLEKRSLPELCLKHIPNIHTVPAVPGFDTDSCIESGGSKCGVRMQGSINLECSFNKWRLVTNTCKWVPLAL